MDRRKHLKILGVGAVTTSVLADACKTDKKEPLTKLAEPAIDRMPEEKAHDDAIRKGDKFFTPDEFATITVLADIIIPKDDVSGSASDAKVADFIEFIVKDEPNLQTPLRGGLRWMDVHCLNAYQKAFKDCSAQQQIEVVDQIAYPEKAKPEMSYGVSFFNLMRNLTATGFYSTQIGWDDIGYVGNKPNQWNGVPEDVQKQYGVAYTEKELKECISFS
ncbi:gluconate 2-dehydrogenase subunit 3 family protein [Parafilimonas terrae]|uniref:Gluconate 2-dehydrogenase subunit 3 n=1 Tax=Parafilimonas terrae TaxID=1465490 RepID=A0A1I5SR01_9BACT|nr:gluconate 2-dehydrogenase subunit 3 family protein [Parafilimonas terrae]SFP73159.1 Gluconate 2-dehydrogenase subunit 3 [Parafilimonas terrae]